MKLSPKVQQAHLVPGYRLDGRYELLYPYAEGGMATVWLARVQGKHGFEKLVAVKTILPHFAPDEAFRKMFLDEASIASRIRHPNVAGTDDLGEENGTLYMVLEWVNGDSWAKLYNAVAARDQALPLPILLRIAADACAGLHAAHELRDETGALLGVVHRDISPQNVLISSTGITKVIDFGIAKALDRVTEETRTGLLKGKAQYTAPEQLLSDRRVDRRADLWAMGTILYQMITGDLPYVGRNDLDTLRLVTSGRPPKPLPPSVPPPIAAVVMRALTHAPEGRFATALEMQRALEAALPHPTTTSDVAAFVTAYLADRMEERRRDLAEALQEAADRAGPKKPRGRLGSYSELAPPPLLEQVLGPRGVPPAAPEEPARQGSAPPSAPITQPPPLAPALAEIDDAVPTRLRGIAELRPLHWLILIFGTILPIVVWGVVAYVAIEGPHGRRPPPSSGGSPR